MHEEGFHQLSMDRVAELAEYSKGTVYQHFSCKEEMLGQLCISSMQHLFELGKRALHYKGSQRERLLAFFIAHDLFQKLEPNDVFMMQNFHSDQVIEKLTDTTQQRHNQLQENIFGLVKTIVEDAMQNGELPRTSLSSGDIVFGLWSLTHGAETLRSYNLPLQELGVADSGAALVDILSRLLDGLGWQPLDQNGTTDVERIGQIRNALFRDDIAAERGRSHSNRNSQ